MRVPVSFAWVLILLTFFTAGLLRQFHDRTPMSPYVPPAVGSLLFAAIFLLLLIAARERRIGAARGSGVRLGSLLPIMLMLLIEKWVSITLYPPLFYWITELTGGNLSLLDARFRAFTAVGLLGVCALVGALSRPAGRRTLRMIRPARWPSAALATAAVVAGTYAILWGVGTLSGHGLRLSLPQPDRVWLWVFGGQALRALAEETYYRGLLLSEMQRLAPRLGARPAAARRWVALLSTSLLFGMEHVTLGATPAEMAQRLIFTLALALLLGMIVMTSRNLHFAAGIHAWVNWLILGAMPRLADSGGEPVPAPGTYIGLSLCLAFVAVFVMARRPAEGRAVAR